MVISVKQTYIKKHYSNIIYQELQTISLHFIITETDTSFWNKAPHRRLLQENGKKEARIYPADRRRGPFLLMISRQSHVCIVILFSCRPLHYMFIRMNEHFPPRVDLGQWQIPSEIKSAEKRGNWMKGLPVSGKRSGGNYF
ncbi:hypothetical protein CDAR_588261 [Caerostris darwini]|uniref:Uncharacterized protein n=1 Tax=Caerostris darwini TaxID=1538125 RepID=A0AAV4S7P1_9ARAC|nr:hypothetical protein CDAR_588261 [Caerostris darwini]